MIKPESWNSYCAIWSPMVMIYPSIQNTDSGQANKQFLLLSEIWENRKKVITNAKFANFKPNFGRSGHLGRFSWAKNLNNFHFRSQVQNRWKRGILDSVVNSRAQTRRVTGSTRVSGLRVRRARPERPSVPNFHFHPTTRKKKIRCSEGVP